MEELPKGHCNLRVCPLWMLLSALGGKIVGKGNTCNYAITSVAPLITDDDDDGGDDGGGGRGFEYVCCWGFLIDCRDAGIRACECSNIYNACTSLHVCVCVCLHMSGNHRKCVRSSLYVCTVHVCFLYS